MPCALSGPKPPPQVALSSSSVSGVLAARLSAWLPRPFAAHAHAHKLGLPYVLRFPYPHTASSPGLPATLSSSPSAPTASPRADFLASRAPDPIHLHLRRFDRIAGQRTTGGGGVKHPVYLIVGAPSPRPRLAGWYGRMRPCRFSPSETGYNAQTLRLRLCRRWWWSRA
ncbi:hypothetical protein DFH09DRAFT_1152501 [Mycena vulgaris]|nr:hypothetical protein DFH09DRAFT_1152501 [Mycena vulgaris]